MNQNFYKNCIVYVFHEKQQQQQLKKWVAKCNLNYQTFAIPLMQVLAEKNRVSTQILRASPVSVTKEFWKLEGTSLLRDSFSSSAKRRDFKIVFYTHFHPHPWHFTCLLQPEAMPVSEFLMQLKSRSTTNTFGIFSLETPPWNPRFLFALQIKASYFSKRIPILQENTGLTLRHGWGCARNRTDRAHLISWKQRDICDRPIVVPWDL